MSQRTAAIDGTTVDPLVGQTLGGRYRLERIIGRGGVGLVYLASDRAASREVVVKVLAPQWSQDPEALARFQREATRLGGLRHPNIVAMHDFGREPRAAYLVMEYLQGELLSSFVDRRGPLDVEVFVPIAAQILKGIGHAHAHQMMLRDIKPANVMLCEHKGRAHFVKLLDFGLAKLIKGDSAITEHHVMGTVGYLSPEQIKGLPLDLRVDVYALGVMFYYMLSGRLPFEGTDNAAVFYKTVNEAVPDLREVAPSGHGLPEGLVQLVHDCLHKQPRDRPHDADEIVERLIEAVPAPLFRLPRIEDVPESLVTHPIPVAETAPSTPNRRDLGTDGHDPARRPVRRWLFGAGLAGVLAAAIAFGLPEDPPIEPASDEASHRAPAGTAAATDDASRQGGPEPSPSHASARPDPSPKRAAHTPASGSAVAPDASPSTGPDAAARGHLEIESRPLANVYVDGHAQGTTPFAGELAVGPHEIRMTARGHAPWTETVEVAPEENSPLSVTLKPKRGAAARAEPAPAPAGASDAAPPTPQSKPSPFLPTKRGDKSAVFLPTKDPH